jgi:hypothetical protein
MICSAPQLPGREHGEQADRDRLTRPGLGGAGPEPAGAEHIGGSQQARDQALVRLARGCDQSAVRERHPQVLGLGAACSDVLHVRAAALVPGLADRAGVVRGHERADDEIAGLDVPHVAAGLLDDTGVLVAHRRRALDGLDTAVGLATATIVPSIPIIITPSATVSRVSCGLPRQRPSLLPGPEAAPRPAAACAAASVSSVFSSGRPLHSVPGFGRDLEREAPSQHDNCQRLTQTIAAFRPPRRRLAGAEGDLPPHLTVMRLIESPRSCSPPSGSPHLPAGSW